MLRKSGNLIQVFSTCITHCLVKYINKIAKRFIIIKTKSELICLMPRSEFSSANFALYKKSEAGDDLGR